ncbi:hypothetical protein ACLK15_06160 [Escherichia coli]
MDTALWLSGGKASLDGGTLLTNDAGEMLFAEHHFSAGPLQITTVCIAVPGVSVKPCRP